MTQVQRSMITLGVVVVVAGGVAGVALWTTHTDEQKSQAEAQQAKLFDLKPEEITGLKIVAQGETTVLSRGPDGWQLTAPVQARADASAIDGLLARLTQLRSTSTVEAHGADLAKYGLAEPVARVSVDAPHGGGELLLGAENSFTGGQYGKRAGSDAVLMLQGTHTAALARTTFELRDKRLAELDPAQVLRIDVHAGGDAYTLVRDGAEGWRMTAPVAQKADPATVASVLAVVSDTGAQAFADETGKELARFGLDKPTATIELTLEHGKQLTLRFGEASPAGEKRLYAQASTQPAIAQVVSGAADPLRKAPAEFEDKTLAHVDREQIGAIEITDSDGARILVQRKRGTTDGGEAESWTQLAPKPGTPSRWKMNALVRLVGNLRATRVVAHGGDLAAQGLDKPSRTLTVQDSAGHPLAAVEFGDVDGNEVYARIAGDPRVMALGKDVLTSLPSGPAGLLDSADGGAAP